MNEVVFDIETIGDIRDLTTMKIVVVSVYEYEKDAYRSFDENELRDLWPILEKADRIIGYNSEHFDLPILRRYHTGDLSKIPHLDILKCIKESCGMRFKLNDIAKATLQMEKSGEGMMVADWYKEGKVDEIKKYCEQDVKVTKNLYDYGRKNKMLYYPTLTGDVTPLAVNFEPPLNSGATNAVAGRGFNLTLPF